MAGLGLSPSRRRRVGAPALWTPSNIAQEWIDPTRPATVVASPYRVASPNPALASWSHPSASKRPSYAANRLTFDGTDDGLLQMAPATPGASVTLPDIATSAAGKGPTCTGLAKVSDGWWVGDHGTETPGEAEATRDAGLIKYSPDFSTMLQRIRLADLGIAQTSVQGVCIDGANGSLWIACPLADRVYNISTAGALLATLSTATVVGANGIAYDSILGCLIVMTMGGTVTWINKSTGASIKTRTFPSNGASNTADMLFFDGSGGGEGVIYSSWGVAGEAGFVTKYDVATNCPMRQWQFPDVLAIEGLWIEGGTLWVANDDFYHNGGAATNKVQSFAIATASPAIGTRLIMAGVARATTPASTRALMVGGSGTVAGNRGAGVFFSTTAGTLNVSVNLAGTNQACLFAIGGYGSDFIFYADVNTAAQTVTLHVNGTQVGAPVALTASGSLPAVMWSLGCMIEINDLARFAPMVLGGAIVTTTATERSRIEGYLAWTTGNVALLPGAHPYKLAAP